ncbi:MAG: DNA polymerase III subunit delta' [SAR324 cluster bacterium]|nr:DNA polymerase III subunit delta' [SAR324 cluster bacterium]
MTFDDIQGQERVIATLRRMIAGGRIPSALLFAGPHNVGKRSTALALAKALNCPEGQGEACGQCPTCRKIGQGVHPDVLLVEPEGQFIRIDQVREVVGSLALNPFEAKKRVVVVAEAERMNPQAAHAFLKTLEEPPADTLIVLCATGAAQLLETIVSRCLPIRFAPLPEEAHGQFGPQLTALIAYLTVVCRMPRLVVQLGPVQVHGIGQGLVGDMGQGEIDVLAGNPPLPAAGRAHQGPAVFLVQYLIRVVAVHDVDGPGLRRGLAAKLRPGLRDQEGLPVGRGQCRQQHRCDD